MALCKKRKKEKKRNGDSTSARKRRVEGVPKEQLMDVLAEVDCVERREEKKRKRKKEKRDRRQKARKREEGIRFSICSLTTKAEVYCM